MKFILTASKSGSNESGEVFEAESMVDLIKNHPSLAGRVSAVPEIEQPKDDPKLAELEKENEALKAELEELKKPKDDPKLEVATPDKKAKK